MIDGFYAEQSILFPLLLFAKTCVWWRWPCTLEAQSASIGLHRSCPHRNLALRRQMSLPHAYLRHIQASNIPPECANVRSLLHLLAYVSLLLLSCCREKKNASRYYYYDYYYLLRCMMMMILLYTVDTWWPFLLCGGVCHRRRLLDPIPQSLRCDN